MEGRASKNKLVGINSKNTGIGALLGPQSKVAPIVTTSTVIVA
jgi:hypothetical protein